MDAGNHKVHVAIIDWIHWHLRHLYDFILFGGWSLYIVIVLDFAHCYISCCRELPNEYFPGVFEFSIYRMVDSLISSWCLKLYLPEFSGWSSYRYRWVLTERGSVRKPSCSWVFLDLKSSTSFYWESRGIYD